LAGPPLLRFRTPYLFDAVFEQPAPEPIYATFL
jgi:hypothetical protein